MEHSETTATAKNPKPIDWSARIHNKAFWLALVPALIILAQVALSPFGYDWDFAFANEYATAVINAVFAVLTILGVVVETSTPGFSDGGGHAE